MTHDMQMPAKHDFSQDFNGPSSVLLPDRKIIVSDCNGTLFNTLWGERYSQKLMNSLASYQQKGHIVILASDDASADRLYSLSVQRLFGLAGGKPDLLRLEGDMISRKDMLQENILTAYGRDHVDIVFDDDCPSGYLKSFGHHIHPNSIHPAKSLPPTVSADLR